jgi:hypothetical protein
MPGFFMLAVDKSDQKKLAVLLNVFRIRDALDWSHAATPLFDLLA